MYTILGLGGGGVIGNWRSAHDIGSPEANLSLVRIPVLGVNLLNKTDDDVGRAGNPEVEFDIVGSSRVDDGSCDPDEVEIDG